MLRTIQPSISIADAAKLLGITPAAVRLYFTDKGMKVPKINGKNRIFYNNANFLFKFKFTKKVIAVQTAKGGTGKTTTADNLASALNVLGARVLLADIDPQGNASEAHGISPYDYPTLFDVVQKKNKITDCVVNLCDGLDILPSYIENAFLDNEIVNKRLPLDKFFSLYFEEIENNYDYIVLDCQRGNAQLATAALLYSDLVIVPINPDLFARRGFKIVEDNINELNQHYREQRIDFKLLVNKFVPNTILLNKELIELASDKCLQDKILSTMIQQLQVLPNLTSQHKNVFSTTRTLELQYDYLCVACEALGLKTRNKNKRIKKKKTDKMEDYYA